MPEKAHAHRRCMATYMATNNAQYRIISERKVHTCDVQTQKNIQKINTKYNQWATRIQRIVNITPQICSLKK